MANRYWVGGTSNWDATAGTKWALTSGGTGGEAVPTASDDVYFDSNSGSFTVTITATGFCRSIDFTGFTGTFTGSSGIQIGTSSNGNIVFSSTMTSTYIGAITLVSSVSGNTITTNGKSFGQLGFNTNGGGWTLTDDLNCRTILHARGTFDTGGYNVYLTGAFQTLYFGSGSRVLNFNSSEIHCSSFDIQNSTSLTYNAGTSVVYIDQASDGFVRSVSGYAIPTVIISVSGIRFLTNSFTVTNLTITDTSSTGTIFQSGLTFTITNFTANGSVDETINRIKLSSLTPGSKYTLAINSASCSYIDVQDSTVTGASTPISNIGGTDSGNNTAGGWDFSSLAIFIKDYIKVKRNVSVFDGLNRNIDLNKNDYPGVVIT